MPESPTQYKPTHDRGYDDERARLDQIRSTIQETLDDVDTNTVGTITAAILRADPHPTNGLNPNYARALDDIFNLRRAAAYESRILEAHYSGIRSFPKSRLAIAMDSVSQLAGTARGRIRDIYPSLHISDAHGRILVGSAIKHGYRSIGLDETLTNAQYERERRLTVTTSEDRARIIAEALASHGISQAQLLAERVVAEPAFEIDDYSEAVTEVYAVRGLFALQAVLLDGHLAMKSFPKSRRAHAERQRARFAALAAGDRVHDDASALSLRSALGRVGADVELSRYWFEDALQNQGLGSRRHLAAST